MRTFIAIDIPEGVKEEIIKIQKEISSFDFNGKLTEKENLHLTLKFIGEIDVGLVEKIKKKLFQVRFSRFETEIDSIGHFDNARSKFYERKLIVWLHLTNCNELQKKVDDALSGLFPVEKRFMSHLTIARIKSVKDKAKFIQAIKNVKISKIRFTVDEFELKESVLMEKGPKYKTLERYKLN